MYLLHRRLPRLFWQRTGTRASVPAYRQRKYSATTSGSFPLKPGTPITGLDVFKDKDPPVALERSEYPEWLSDLPKPLPTLKELREMNLLEAEDKYQKRYLKLTRRIAIKNVNDSLRKKKY